MIELVLGFAKTRLLDTREGIWGASLGFAVILFLHVIAGDPVITGDEPRYVAEALMLLGLPHPEIAIMHSPLHLVPVAGVVALFGGEAGRLAMLVCSAVGYFSVFALLRRKVGPGWALLTTFVGFVTIPLVAYARQLYPEIALFSIFALSWYLLEKPGKHRWEKAAFLTTALALPYFHLRMALVAPTLILAFLASEFSADRQLLSPRFLSWFAIAALASAVAVAGLVFYQIALTGSLLGTASAPFPPGLPMFVERLGLQLFGLRHGLLVWNPLLYCALAGLAIATVRGDRLAVHGALFLAVYLVTFVWGSASEASPARFWAAIMPVFLAGLALWFVDCKGLLVRLVTVLFAGWSLLIGAMFFAWPTWFLYNREVSVFFDWAFSKVGLFYFPVIQPIDPFRFLAGGVLPDHMRNMVLLAIVGGVGCAVLAWLILASRANASRWAVILSGGTLVIGIALVLVSTAAYQVPESQLEIEKTASAPGRRSAVTLSFSQPLEPLAVRFPESIPHWVGNDSPDRFLLSIDRGDRRFVPVGVIPAGHVTFLPELPPVTGLRLEAIGPATDSDVWLASTVSVVAPFAIPRPGIPILVHAIPIRGAAKK